MELNRKGVTRLVFVFNKTVVKIPNFTCQWSHFLHGLLANINENKTWKYNSGKYESGLNHLLCPVLWCSYGGWILIMKKASLITEENRYLFNTSEHEKHFKGDDTISNYGILNNKIDYGN